MQAVVGPMVLVAMVIFLMRQSLFSGGKLIPAFPRTDLPLEFLGWRNFAFSQWKAGHFPWWNPHVFCGIPFFAQIQSCLFYPVAWINFFCNTMTATTIEIAANLSIAAIGTYAWARQRKISRYGATLAGAAFAFSGPIYLRVMAGHMSTLGTLAWMPLVFLALDRILAGRFLSGIIAGSIAVCLQWLGGHPQFVYYTMLTAGIYTLVNILWAPPPFRKIFAVLFMFVLGTSLAAIQVIPSILVSHAAIRSGPMAYEFASSFSFDHLSLLTFLTPYLLGDATHAPYAGPWNNWELSAYLGIINLVLALIALSCMERHRLWRTVALLAMLFILMLGACTPVYMWLYRFLPGFADFRGVSKFSALLVLMLSVLAGEGFDLVRNRRMQRRGIIVIVVSALFLGLGVIFLCGNRTSGPAAQVIAEAIRLCQSYHQRLLYQINAIIRFGPWMAYQCFMSGAVLLAAGVLIYLRRLVPIAPYLLLVLAVGEIYFAAWDATAADPVERIHRGDWLTAFDQARAADQRILFTNSAIYGNDANTLDIDSLWGYDPAQPLRYSQLIAAATGQHILAGEEFSPNFARPSRIYPLLRAGYVVRFNINDSVIQVPQPMAHLQLMGASVTMTDQNAIAASLANDFDFHHLVILEKNPQPAPTVIGTFGTAQLLHQSINDLEISADLPAPALLLITDAFASGWQATAIEPNPHQSHYEILRADDVLRAIPLSAGHHHIDVYYTAPGFAAGAIVSAIAAMMYVILLGLKWRSKVARSVPAH
ncbi:MAG TPA: hypothetical protein VGG19_09600 [Tepidisphaeraceae bacterium]